MSLCNYREVKLLRCKTKVMRPADVLTFSENISSIEIYHSESTPQSFAVNGLTLIVAAGGWRSPIAGTPGVTVGIPTGVNCIVARLV